MHDEKENVKLEFEEEFCENCPLLRQLPPMFGQPYPMPPMGPGPGFGQFFGQGPDSGPPSGPPPSITPQTSAVPGTLAIDSGAIRRCRFRFVYLRLRGRREFWAWLVYVGRRSVAGWRWTGSRWVYFGVDLRQIVDFQCF